MTATDIEMDVNDFKMTTTGIETGVNVFQAGVNELKHVSDDILTIPNPKKLTSNPKKGI